jgi:hypothetical protein
MHTAMPTGFYEFLMTFDEAHRFPLMVVMIMGGTMALMFLSVVVALTVRSMYKHRLNDALKRELVERGLSGEEIERIVGRKATAVRPGVNQT